MNRPVNAQRSASESPPTTPPRRTARSPFTPNNNNETLLHRPRRAQQNRLPPHALSLAQASASIVQERLQQHQGRLQIQLLAQPPVSSAVPAVSVKAFLDTTFRAYASRIQTEFTNLRAQCARAVQHEQHRTAEIRGTCTRLAHERDVAQEKYRVLLERRARAGKRTRAQVETEDAAADSEITGLQYPPSPVSPPQLPTQSPPPRLLSPFVLAVRRSPSHTPDPEDTTGFDLTLSCDSISRPSKKRRVSRSPERTLVPASIASPHPEDICTATKERETCPPAPAGCGECDMDLESDSDCGSEAESESATDPSTSRSRSPSRVVSQTPSSESKPCQDARPTPPSACARKVHLDLEYVDIMYMPTDGKLVCRVCLLAATSSKGGNRSGRVQAFLPATSWEMLRAHCEEAHPDACRDVVGLGKAGVRELRRRLGLGMMA